MENYRVVCFNGDTNQYQDVLMWGHYGDSHSGIKITFNDKFYQFINQQFIFHPITYSNKRITIQYSDDQKVIDQKIYDALYHKSQIWRDENEHRIIYNISENNPTVKIGEFLNSDGSKYNAEYITIEPDWIEQVDISCNMSSPQIGIVRNILDNNFKVQMRKARICVVNYELHYDLL